VTRTSDRKPTQSSGRGQLLLHIGAAVAAWALFVWAWYVVFLKRTSEQAMNGLLALGVFLVVMLLLTLTWVQHNLRIHRRKTARAAVPTVREDWAHDILGRRIEAEWPALKAAPLVEVELSEESKRYRVGAMPAGPSRRGP
jgi:hypothetical protein